jgi:hypothetical protein
MDENKELKKSIDQLTLSNKRSNSLGWGFLHGMAGAIGGAIGLAILVVIAVYILKSVPDTNMVGKFFHAIATVINRNQK